MGETVKCQHIFRGAGGTTLDDYVNTFYIFSNENLPDPNDIANFGLFNSLCDNICDLYIHADGTGTKPGDYMSHRLYGQDETVKVYSMANYPGPLGEPIFVHHKISTAGFPDVQGLPEEVAVCLSYNALDSGSNAGRRRGRIYIGPLSIAAMDDVAPADAPVHVVEPFINSLNAAAENLQTAMATIDMSWRVWSQTDGFGFDIVQSSVDNAFDTIRGRGTEPTTRTYNTFS